jgi:hypothetical protein
MELQILALYRLAQQVERHDLLAALELALEQQTFGAEYIQALLAAPPTQPPRQLALSERPMPSFLAVPQHVVERDLAHYEQYVANREQALVVSGAAL